MASSNILLEDIFHVKNIDEDGKKWVRGRPRSAKFIVGATVCHG
jgi:hypothetical protein